MSGLAAQPEAGPGAEVRPLGPAFQFGAFVTGVAFDGPSAVFALGDGTVRFVAAGAREAREIALHQGAVLALAAAPWGGVLTGGDDGAFRHVTIEGRAATLATFAGCWIERVAASAASGAVACSAGKDAIVLGEGLASRAAKRFPHAATVAGLAFDPKGKRIATAHYGGATLWWIAADAPQPSLLAWKGAHLDVTVSPGGQFVVTAMQENALHGWRLSDKAHMRMSGYPAKVQSWSWLLKGRLLATSGAERIVLWPFDAKTGPMGQSAREAGPAAAGRVTAVAGHPMHDLVASGHADGDVHLTRLSDDLTLMLRRGTGAAVSALAFSPDGSRLAFGDEGGFAAVIERP